MTRARARARRFPNFSKGQALSRLLGELAHGGTAGNSGIEQNVSTCGNIEKVIRYRPSISLVARQCWSSRAGEAAQHESGYPWPWHGMSNFFIPLWT
jgi:hypothetical protein